MATFLTWLREMTVRLTVAVLGESGTGAMVDALEPYAAAIERAVTGEEDDR